MAIVNRETDYALRVLTRLAQDDGFLPVSVLAESEEVPEDFLRKIMQHLNKAGIVESRQGPFGGYRLSVEPSEITLRDVVRIVQGPLLVNECFGEPGICKRVRNCPFRERLRKLQDDLAEELQSIRLSDIVEQIPEGDAADTRHASEKT